MIIISFSFRSNALKWKSYNLLDVLSLVVAVAGFIWTFNCYGIYWFICLFVCCFENFDKFFIECSWCVCEREICIVNGLCVVIVVVVIVRWMMWTNQRYTYMNDTGRNKQKYLFHVRAQPEFIYECYKQLTVCVQSSRWNFVKASAPNVIALIQTRSKREREIFVHTYTPHTHTNHWQIQRRAHAHSSTQL